MRYEIRIKQWNFGNINEIDNESNSICMQKNTTFANYIEKSKNEYTF